MTFEQTTHGEPDIVGTAPGSDQKFDLDLEQWTGVLSHEDLIRQLFSA